MKPQEKDQDQTSLSGGCARFLLDIYQTRKLKNPAYSMRAFAKSIGVSHVTASQYLNGEAAVHPDRAEKISMNLGLSELERSILVALSKIEGSPDSEEKKALFKKLKSDIAVKKRESAENEIPANIKADAIEFLLLLELKTEFQNNLEWARALKLSLSRFEEVLCALNESKIVFGMKPPFLLLNNHTFSSGAKDPYAIKAHYLKIMQKIQIHLDESPPEERMIGSESFVIDETQIAEARTLTYQYLDAMAALSMRAVNPSLIMHGFAAAIVQPKKGSAGRKL